MPPPARSPNPFSERSNPAQTTLLLQVFRCACPYRLRRYSAGVQKASAEQTAYSHAQHAFSLSEQGNGGTAEDQYRKALSVLDVARLHIGREVGASYELGEAEFAKGNQPEALKMYRRALDAMDTLRMQDTWWRGAPTDSRKRTFHNFQYPKPLGQGA